MTRLQEWLGGYKTYIVLASLIANAGLWVMKIYDDTMFKQIAVMHLGILGITVNAKLNRTL